MFSQTSFDIRKIFSSKKYLNKRAIIITQFKYAISNFGTKKTGLLYYKNSMIGPCLYIYLFLIKANKLQILINTLKMHIQMRSPPNTFYELTYTIYIGIYIHMGNTGKICT